VKNGRHCGEILQRREFVHVERDVQCNGQSTTRFGHGKCILNLDIATNETMINDVNWLQMNGTEEVRHVFKTALGVGYGKNFVRGTTKTDAHTFLKHVCDQYTLRYKKSVHYSFKECSRQKSWNVGRLEKQLSRQGKYVFFGATRNTSDSHKAQFRGLKKEKSPAEAVKKWLDASVLLNTHAVSVVIDSNCDGVIYDNGCTSGEKVYSVLNIAERMRSLSECYVLELWQE
jgi:hypothetical protein